MLDHDSAGCYNRNAMVFNLIMVYSSTTDNLDEANDVHQTRGVDVFAK